MGEEEARPGLFIAAERLPGVEALRRSGAAIVVTQLDHRLRDNPPGPPGLGHLYRSL